MGVYTTLPENLQEVDVVIAGGKHQTKRQTVYND